MISEHKKHKHILCVCVLSYTTFPVGDQLDAQIFYIIRLFQSSTCFEQTREHHQELTCINTVSGIVPLKTNGWSKITKYNLAALFKKIIY